MKVAVTVDVRGVLIQVLAEDGGGLLGDFTTEVKPGQSAFGKPHEWWVELGSGEHEIKGTD